MGKIKQHFAFQHPTFGTDKRPLTPSHWQRSVYYWWFEYLRRNEDYRQTCESKGNGPCHQVYEDFGDVFVVDFKTWWRTDERGARLFAEPPARSIEVVPAGTNLKTDNPELLTLQVPLNLPITHLVQRFREIVSKHHDGRRGVRRSSKSQALYQVSGKVDVQFLQTALQVWDARKADPKKPLWQIANDLRLGSKLNLLKENEIAANSPTVKDKKNILAATASRYIRKAELLIREVGQGRF